VDEVVVPHLVDYLEDAYNQFKSMGFNYKGVESIEYNINAVDVLVRDLKDEKTFAKSILKQYTVVVPELDF